MLIAVLAQVFAQQELSHRANNSKLKKSFAKAKLFFVCHDAPICEANLSMGVSSRSIPKKQAQDFLGLKVIISLQASVQRYPESLCRSAQTYTVLYLLHNSADHCILKECCKLCCIPLVYHLFC